MGSSWTEEEIRARLGVSSSVLGGNERVGAREIALIREAGLVRLEICGYFSPLHFNYRDRKQISEIMSECRKQGISIVSVHGPKLQYACAFEEVRKVVVKEAVIAARAAAEMGASIFVAHFLVNDISERTVCEMLDQLEDTDIKLVVENGVNLREHMPIVDRIDSDRFGMNIDIGHTRDPDGINPFLKEGRAREALAECGHRILHLHLHDYSDTDHYPPFDGNIQWGDLFAALKDIEYGGQLMFEPAPRVSVRDSLIKVAAFPKVFMKRYGGVLRQRDE